MELLDPIIDFFCKLYDADKRPEARKFTVGCFHIVLIVFVVIAVIFSRS
jgi:hypothetical protein